MTCGVYTCLYDIDEDYEDEVEGKAGQWTYNEYTDEGAALKAELEVLTTSGLSIEQEEIRRVQLANLIDKDLSQIIGYAVTIQYQDGYIAFANYEDAGKWHKVETNI